MVSPEEIPVKEPSVLVVEVLDESVDHASLPWPWVALVQSPAHAEFALLRGAVAALEADASPSVLRAALLAACSEARSRARAEALERLAAAGEVAASVAHEIDNPLTYVIANVDFARDALAGDPAAREVVEALDEAHSGLLRAVGVARDLSLLVREARVETIDLTRVVRGAVAMVRPRVERVARLNVHVEGKLLVRASEQRLYQVLVNLLVNASQSIEPDQAVHNEVRVLGGQHGNRVWVVVADTGTGIPDEIKHRVFEPFFTTKNPGTGLGLSLCRRYLDEMNGAIELQSTPGGGTVARIELPAVSEGITVPDIEESENAVPRVLIVDDEVAIGRAFSRALSRTCEVTTAASAEEALGLLAQDAAFDVVVSDIQMPGMGGLALVERVAVGHSHLLGRMVVVTGGRPDPIVDRRLRDLGVTRLQKPIGLEQMRTIVHDICGPA